MISASEELGDDFDVKMIEKNFGGDSVEGAQREWLPQDSGGDADRDRGVNRYSFSLPKEFSSAIMAHGGSHRELLETSPRSVSSPRAAAMGRGGKVQGPGIVTNKSSSAPPISAIVPPSPFLQGKRPASVTRHSSNETSKKRVTPVAGTRQKSSGLKPNTTTLGKVFLLSDEYEGDDGCVGADNVQEKPVASGSPSTFLPNNSKKGAKQPALAVDLSFFYKRRNI